MFNFIPLVFSAILEGFFLAMYLETGYNISPTGIALMIINFFEPYISLDSEEKVESLKVLVTIIPLGITAWGILRAGLKIGLLTFIPILLVSYTLFVTFIDELRVMLV